MTVIWIGLCLVSVPARLEAKAWLNGHIVEMRSDGFVLQTRFYRYIVHTDDTEVRCKKQRLPLTDWQLQDLVTVEGSFRYDSVAPANSIMNRVGILCILPKRDIKPRRGHHGSRD